MKRIYKNNDIQFNLTLNSFPFDEKMVDTIDFKFYTKSKGNYIAKTKADIKDGVIILEWSELSKLERGVLFYSYSTSSFNEEFQDKYHNTSNEVMTDYYLMTEDNIDVEVVFTEWGRIKGEVDNQQDLVKYVDNKIKTSTEPIYLKKEELPTKVSAFENDAKYLQKHQDISGKADKVYVDNQLKLKENTTSVDNKLSKKADKTTVEAELSKKANTTDVDGKLALKADKDTVTSQLSTKADKTEIPTKVSQLQNDKGYLTSHQDISGKADKTDVDNKLSKKVDKVSGKGLSSNDYSNADKAEVGKVKDKQDTLVSGTNIKTINNQSILGKGNITIEGGSGGGTSVSPLVDVPQWVKDSLVCYYNPKKQGLTNKEIQEKGGNFTLKDFSDNHLDMQMHNFQGSGMSGMNGYPFTFNSFWNQKNYGTILSDYSVRIETTIPISSGSYFYRTDVKCSGVIILNVIGLTDNGKLNVSFRKNTFSLQEGINTIETNYIEDSGSSNTFGITCSEKLTKAVNIEILPSYEDALVFDGVDDFGTSEGQPVLTDYTVIAKRKVIGKYGYLASKSTGDAFTQGAFIFEGNDTFSFGSYTTGINKPELISYQTKSHYNSKPIGVGSATDTSVLTLGASNNLGALFFNGAIYQFLLFNRTLSEKEIDWVKQNLMGEVQPKLVSGENIKTINNQSILGEGNITIEGSEVYPQWFKESLVCYYNPKKQNLTNQEIKDKKGEFVLKDFSSNHLDMQMHNFAGDYLSGMGGYGDNFLKPMNKNKCTLEEHLFNKMKVTTIQPSTGNLQVMSEPTQSFNWYTYKLKIEGLTSEDIVLVTYYEGEVKKRITFRGSGIFDVPSSTATKTESYPVWMEFKCATPKTFTLEQLPMYEDALVFDGVDDFGRITNDKLKLDDYTVIVKRKLISFSNENFSTVITKRDSRNRGAFWFEQAKGTWSCYGLHLSYDKPIDELISYQTKYTYNGVEIPKFGELIADNSDMSLGCWMADIDTPVNCTSMALYQVLVFNKTLSSNEIQWVKENIMDDFSPIDGNIYARKDGRWFNLSSTIADLETRIKALENK